MSTQCHEVTEWHGEVDAPKLYSLFRIQLHETGIMTIYGPWAAKHFGRYQIIVRVNIATMFTVLALVIRSE